MMDTAQAFPVKKAFLYSLVASVLFTALSGILAILSGRFGWVEIRIVLTTVTIAASSLCGLACGAYLGTKTGRLLPVSGIVLTLLVAVMVIAAMWIEISSVLYWKLTVSFSVFAVACAHLSLLSMARIAEWFHWSLIVAHVIIFGVASLIVLMVFFEIHESGMFRLLGVAAIVDAAITILVPIFHRLSRSEFPAKSAALPSDNDAALDAEIATLSARMAELERRKDPRSEGT